MEQKYGNEQIAFALEAVAKLLRAKEVNYICIGVTKLRIDGIITEEVKIATLEYVRSQKPTKRRNPTFYHCDDFKNHSAAFWRITDTGRVLRIDFIKRIVKKLK